MPCGGPPGPLLTGGIGEGPFPFWKSTASREEHVWLLVVGLFQLQYSPAHQLLLKKGIGLFRRDSIPCHD